MPHVLLIDNYDSFTFNLSQLIASLGAHVEVVKNDQLTAAQVFAKKPTHIVISPGPGSPADARISNDILLRYRKLSVTSLGPRSSPEASEVSYPLPAHARTQKNFPLPPLLGVCLGHQCLASIFTSDRNPVHRAPKPMHGKTSMIHHDGKSIMRGVPSPFLAARYHSLIVDALPSDFELMCWTASRMIMGIRHISLPLFGVQFHPESFMTEHGAAIIRNFLKL